MTWGEFKKKVDEALFSLKVDHPDAMEIAYIDMIDQHFDVEVSPEGTVRIL